MKPEPLTPADCDLRSFGWMPVDVVGLRDSDFVVLVSAEAFRAGMLLWCASWHQRPAASLPNEDRLLASLAGYGRDLEGWGAIREDAMRGFVECSDGRFYHPVIAQKAIEADIQRKKQRKQTEAATAARRRDKRNDQRDDDRNEVHDVQRNEDQQTGEDKTLPDRRESISRPIEVDRPKRAPEAEGTQIDLEEAIAAKAPGFEEFWKGYPRRDGPNPRKPAEQRFNALVKSGLDPAMLIAEVKKFYQAESARSNVGTRFIPQATTWLNQQRWSDHAAVAFMLDQSDTEMAIEDAVKMFAKLGHWSRHAGPSPGSVGCRASVELLAKYGLGPDGQKLELAMAVAS